MESIKAEKRNCELAETYFNGLAVKTKAQEIAKTCTSYRRLLVVALGQLKRMQAATVALPRGPLRSEQEAILTTAEQEVKCLQGQTKIIKNMADACVFADGTFDSAAFFAMVSR